MSFAKAFAVLKMEKKNKNERNCHRLVAEGRRRRDKRISRTAFHSIIYYLCSIIFGLESDKALISLTGFGYRYFRYIEKLFSPIYDLQTTYSCDGRITVKWNAVAWRKWSMDAPFCLGKSLSRYRKRGSLTTVCILFGIARREFALFLRFSQEFGSKIGQNLTLCVLKCRQKKKRK